MQLDLEKEEIIQVISAIEHIISLKRMYRQNNYFILSQNSLKELRESADSLNRLIIKIHGQMDEKSS